MDWNAIIRTAIKQSGRTTYAIAKESGVPVQVIDRFVAGGGLRLETAEKIASVVGVTLTRKKK